MGTRREIDNAARRIIRWKAWTLAHSAGFVPSDQKDIEQELTLHLLRRVPKFDPERGEWQPFVYRVLENRTLTLVEHRRARKRDYRRESHSLNAPVESETGVRIERGEILKPSDIDPSARGASRDHDLQIDIGHFIYGLPPELSSTCRRLASQSVTEISRETGIPRGTLYDAIKRIREAAAAAGLRDYLSDDPTL